jgi:hypothetical protein
MRVAAMGKKGLTNYNDFRKRVLQETGVSVERRKVNG